MSETQDNNAEIGYEVAVNLLGILLGTSWSRFNAMVLANSIIIGMLGLILTNYKNRMLLIFAILLSLVGILLARYWFSLMARDSEFQHFYMVSARHFERELSRSPKNKSPAVPQSIPITTLLNGARLAHGWPVKYPDLPVNRDDNVKENDENILQMKGSALWKAQDNIKHTIYLFAVTYLSIIALAVLLYFDP